MFVQEVMGEPRMKELLLLLVLRIPGSIRCSAVGWGGDVLVCGWMLPGRGFVQVQAQQAVTLLIAVCRML